MKKFDSKIDGQNQVLKTHSTRLDAIQADIKWLVDALLPNAIGESSMIPAVESDITNRKKAVARGMFPDITPLRSGAGILGPPPSQVTHQMPSSLSSRLNSQMNP